MQFLMEDYLEDGTPCYRLYHEGLREYYHAKEELADDMQSALSGIAEYIADQRGDSSASGWGLTLAHEKPLARGLESAHTVVRIQSWDPSDTEGKDRDVTLTSAYLLSWTTLGDSELFTGLTYELRAPEDQYEAIEHGILGQARIVF